MELTIEELEPLEDPGHGNAERHSLHDILVIALYTIVCCGHTYTNMALFGHSKRMPFSTGPPYQTTQTDRTPTKRLSKNVPPAAVHRFEVEPTDGNRCC